MSEAVKGKKVRITHQSMMLTALCVTCVVVTVCLPNPHTSRAAMIEDLGGMGFVIACLGWVGWRIVRLAKELKAL